MGTCVVRKVLSPKEAKLENKKKHRTKLIVFSLVALFVLLFGLILLCVFKYGIIEGLEQKGVKVPNFCLPWWGMLAVLLVLYIGAISLIKKAAGQYVLKVLTLVMFILTLTSFYFGLFYLSTIFICGGLVCICLMWRKLGFKQKIKFLPIFVLLCYVGLVVYFFALIN